MRVFPLSLFLASVSFTTAWGQQPSIAAVQRDPQAVQVLQQSIAAMGGLVPSDSLATGTIAITAGPTTENGTIRIQTRGYDQTAEQINTPTKNVKLVFSRGAAAEFQSGAGRKMSLERAVTAQSWIFPLAALTDPSNSLLWGLKYVGLEQLDICRCHHIQVWESFADKPALHAVAEVSQKDIWIDSTSVMVKRVFYRVREARGPAVLVLPVEITFSDYRNVNGFAYPFTIQSALNGTAYSTITIQSVVFNSGLIETDFSVR